MLFYLATYPRSGNSLLQRILALNFGQLSSQVKVGARPGRQPLQVPGWRMEAAAEPVADWPEQTVWNGWTAVYRRDADGQPWRRYLTPAPIDAFTEDFRRSLAGEQAAFFVKTHDRPFNRYFDGEHVLQVVRDPGPVIWSCFRYLTQHVLQGRALRPFEQPAPTLERIIAGDVQFGGWSDDHRDWAAASAGLGPRYRQMRYRQMIDDQAGFRDALADFAGLEPVSTDPVNFETYRRKRAALDLRGTDDGYEQFFSHDQLERLWTTHGEIAQRLGFPPPDLEAAGANDQLARLTELLDLAWREAGGAPTSA